MQAAPKRFAFFGDLLGSVAMATPARLKFRLRGSKDEAIKAILEGLPKDTIVRDEDDGVGRFAGERTVVVTGLGRERLMLFSGTYGSIKNRLETPQLDVAFEAAADGVTARLTVEEPKRPSIVARVVDLVGYMATVAAVVVAYHMFRSLEVDTQQTAIVSVGGGLAWAAIAHYIPKRQDFGLREAVTKALQPMVVPKKAAPKAKAAPEPEAAPEPTD